jgi:hypothetical protein
MIKQRLSLHHYQSSWCVEDLSYGQKRAQSAFLTLLHTEIVPSFMGR